MLYTKQPGNGRSGPVGRLATLRTLAMLVGLCLSAAVPTLNAAEDFQWARKISDTAAGTETVKGMAVDSNGNILVMGEYTGTTSFGPAGNLTATGRDLYVAKMDRLGNFIWAKRVGGSGDEFAYGPNSLAVGPGNLIYITGRFASADLSVAGSSTVAASGTVDVFIAQLDTDGIPQWVVHPTSAGGVSARGRGICVNGAGDCFVIGHTNGNVTFPTTPTATIVGTGGTQAVWVTKVDITGATQWAVGTGGNNTTDGNAIAVAPGGADPYICGWTNSTNISFAPLGGTKSTAGADDIMVAKLDGSNGNFLYAMLAGGTGADQGYGICVDSSNRAIICGSFTGTATFGTLPGLAATGTGLDAFVASANAAGSDFLWQLKAGANNIDDNARAVLIDGAGNIAVTGECNNNAAFGALPAVTTAGGADAFIARIDPATPVWLVAKAGGSTGAEVGETIAQSGTATLIAGEYAATATFGLNPTLALSNATDVFVAKFAPVVKGVSVVQTGTGTAVTEGGATDTYYVALDAQPANNVTITPTPDTNSTIGPGPLTFTTANWSTPQVVTVTAVNDNFAQGTHSSTITHAAASADLAYNGIGVASVVATVTDNDTAGVTVTPGTLTLDEAAVGTTRTFQVKLTAQPQPAQVVQIDTGSDTVTGVTLDKANLVFSTANWNVDQVVTVTVVNDAVDEANPHNSNVTLTVNAGATTANEFDAVVIANVVYSIADNDTAGVTITQSGGTTDVVENGATDSYTIVLNSQPTNNVTITVTPDAQSNVSGGPWTFTPANWFTAQSVTVTAVNNAVADGNRTSTITHSASSVDPNYTGGVPVIANVVANITDDEVAGITVTPGTLTLDEATPATTRSFSVVLDVAPPVGLNVVIDLTSDTVKGVTLSTSQLTFTNGTWNTPQNVTVTVVNDNFNEANPHNSNVTLTVNNALTTANSFDSLPLPTQIYSIADNDPLGVTVTPGTLTLDEAAVGTTRTFQVKLNSQPQTGQVVQIDTGSDTVTGVTLDKANLTFTNANWNVNQTVTVTVVNDAVDEANPHNSNVTLTVNNAATTANEYDSFAIPNLVYSIADNDTAGITVVESGGTTNVNEAGATSDTFTMVLTSQPTASVTISFTTNTTTGVTASAPLVFTTANWFTAQTVTVTAVDDSAIESNPHTDTVAFTVTCTDPNYGGFAVTPVTVNIADNDAPTIILTLSGGNNTVTEGGATDTFQVKLGSQPVSGDDPVTISFACSTPGRVTFSPTTMTFLRTGGNWNTNQTLTITAVDNATYEGNQVYNITVSAASAFIPPTGYNGASSVTSVTVNDNDTPGAVVGAIPGINEAGPGNTGIVKVHLSSQPTANVTVTATSTDTVTGLTITSAALVFDGTNWATDQDVTFIAVNDSVDEGASQNVTVNLTYASADTTYNALPATPFSVTITDDDTAGFTVGGVGGQLDESRGNTLTFTVRLNSQPAPGNVVVIDLASDTVKGVSTSTSQLTFTNANWNLNQIVTVSPVDDKIYEGNHSDTVTRTVNAGLTTANEYDALPLTSLTYNIYDNDEPGVQFSAANANWDLVKVGQGGGGQTHACAVDKQGNMYLAGYYNVSMTIDGTTVTSLGGPDCFLVKFNSSGVMQWFKSFGGTGADRILAITTDPAGNIYCTGQYQGTATFAPLAPLVALGSWDIFVVKVDTTNGNCIWERSVGDPAGSSIGWSLTADENFVYLSGGYAGVATFPGFGNPGPATGSSPDSFISKINPATGSFIWVRQGSNPGSSTAYSIAVGHDGRVYAVGDFDFTSGNMNWAPFSVGGPGGFTEYYLVVADNNGNILNAQAAWSPTGNSTYLNSVAADRQGHVYIRGQYTLDFQMGPFFDAGGNTLFVMQVDGTTNSFNWFQPLRYNGGAPIPQSTPTGLVSDPAGTTYFSTYFGGNITVPGFGVLNGGTNTPVLIGMDNTGTVTFAKTVTNTGATNFTGLARNPNGTLTVATSLNNNSTWGQIQVTGAATATGLGRFAPAVNTTEGGATDTINVVLTSQPSANVTVTLAPDSQEGTAPSPLTFTPGNWNTPQPVTVTATNDLVAEAAPQLGLIGATVASTDPNYSGIAGGRCLNVITDNDTPGVSTTESGGSTDVAEGGATDTYTVVLISQPTQDVTITLGFDATQVSVSASSLTFTAGNWMTPQTVTVTAVDDPLIEGTPHNTTITQTASSLDPFYNGIAVASVLVKITDNDNAGVTVTESGGTTNVAEGGATDTYTLVLTAQPAAPVTVNISTDGQTTTSTTSVVFTALTWSTPQTITVTAVDDPVDEVSPHTGVIKHTTASLDANFNGLAVADVNASITDNDVAQVVVTQSGGTTAVAEGGATDSFTVVLATQPTANVTVTIATDSQTTSSTASVTFTTVSWNLPQTVTITAVDDQVDETNPHPSVITLGNNSGDPFYNAGGIIVVNAVVTNTINASVTDNDVAGVVITPTGGSNDVVEGGGTDTYDVRLATQPTQDVTITLTNDAQATTSPTTLTFTSANWATAQIVTATAVDDFVAEGSHTSTVTYTVGSLDGFYNGLAVTATTINITDNDFPKVIVTPSGSSTDVTEGGATDTYDVVLQTQPTATVTVMVTPDAQITVDKATLTFDNTNWNTPQTVTVTAVDDLVAETSPHLGVIAHSSASTDTFYGGLGVNPMNVNITDNDVAGITVTQSSASTAVIEGGATDTFDVVLDTMPTTNVTVNITPDAQTTVGPTSLLFTPGNYATPQTVTVTAVVETPTIVVGAANPPEAAVHPGVIVLSTTTADTFYQPAGVFMVDGTATNTITANVSDKSIKVTSPGYGQSANIDPTPGSIARVGGTVTVTTLTAHYLTVGQVVTIASVTDSTFNGSYPVTGTPSATSFTYVQPSLGDASSDSGTVTLNSPEVYNAGATRKLNWIALGGVTNVVVQYSAAGNFSDTVTVGTFAANSNPLSFTVPLVPAANARVRIVDSVTAGIYGESAPFSIVVPSLQMLAPNGGETFNMDDLQVVSWNSVGNIPTVNIEVSSQATMAIANNGISRTAGIVTVTTASNHSYNIGDEVIVSGVSNTTFNGVFIITSTSPNTFTYSQAGTDTISTGGTTLVLVWAPIPALTGIPNTGSVSWTVETPATAITSVNRSANLVTVVTTTPTGIKVGDSVLVKNVTDPSFNGTQTVTSVTSSTQFSFLQAGPNAASSGGELHESSQTVRLRVSDPSQPSLNDYSDSDFSILNPGIFLITPNGGETINRKSSFLIQWLTVPSNSSVPLVDIDISLDGGATWSVGTLKDTNGNVAQNLPNTGSFLWDVSEAATPNAKIRVRNSAGGLGVGISVAPFTILGQFNVDQTLITLDPVVKSSGFDPQFTPVQNFTLTTEEDWAIVSIDPLTSQFGDFPWLQVREAGTSHAFYGAAPGQGTVGRTHPLYSGTNPAYVLGDLVATAGGGATRASNVVTITTTTAHGYQVGDRVFIKGVNDTSFNSATGTTFVITAVPTSTTFTYNQTGPNANSEDGTSAVFPHGKTTGGATADAVVFNLSMDPGNLPEGDYVGLIRLRGLNTGAERLVVVRGTVTDAFRVHVPIINKNLISSDFQGTVKYQMMQNFRGTLPPFTAQVQNLSKLDQVTFSTTATTTVGSAAWLEIASNGSGWQTSLPNQTAYPVPIEILSSNGAIRGSNVVTIATVAAHNFKVGDTVTITGVTDSSFNGTFTITTITTNTFSYAQTGPDATSDSGFASIGPSTVNFDIHINQALLPTQPGVYSGLVQFFSITGETRVINVQVTVQSTTARGKKSKCDIGQGDGTSAALMFCALLGVAGLMSVLARRRGTVAAD